MTAYRAPDFNERLALARQAKQKALDKLRAKPVPTEAEMAERRAAQAKRDQAEAEQRARRAAKKLAEEQEAEAARVAAAEAAQAAEAARLAAIAPVKTEAQRKAERDARYAARKNRK